MHPLTLTLYGVVTDVTMHDVSATHGCLCAYSAYKRQGLNVHSIIASEDIKQKQNERTSTQDIVQELCESRGGRPGLSVLTSLQVSVDVKNY